MRQLFQNLEVTNEVDICIKCYDLLQIYFARITSWLENEEKLQKYCELVEREQDERIDLTFFSIHLQDNSENARNDSETEEKVVISHNEIHIKDDEDEINSQ